MLVLAGLLGLGAWAVPIAVSAVLATSLAASILGIGGMVWLLEQHRQHLPQRQVQPALN